VYVLPAVHLPVDVQTFRAPPLPAVNLSYRTQVDEPRRPETPKTGRHSNGVKQ
jgi:hypothetical protein